MNFHKASIFRHFRHPIQEREWHGLDINYYGLEYYRHYWVWSSDILDSLTSKSFTSVVRINARFVCWEIFIDNECAFYWSIRIDFFHNGFFVRWESKIVSQSELIVGHLLKPIKNWDKVNY